MKRKSPLVLILLLCSVWTTIINVDNVNAQSTIFIRADGSVEGTDKIQQTGNFYTFTENINGSVVIEKDNIVVDGAGFVLQGTTILQETGIGILSVYIFYPERTLQS